MESTEKPNVHPRLQGFNQQSPCQLSGHLCMQRPMQLSRKVQRNCFWAAEVQKQTALLNRYFECCKLTRVDIMMSSQVSRSPVLLRAHHQIACAQRPMFRTEPAKSCTIHCSEAKSCTIHCPEANSQPQHCSQPQPQRCWTPWPGQANECSNHLTTGFTSCHDGLQGHESYCYGDSWECVAPRLKWVRR